jgi:hypothetical protein
MAIPWGQYWRFKSHSGDMCPEWLAIKNNVSAEKILKFHVNDT